MIFCDRLPLHDDQRTVPLNLSPTRISCEDDIDWILANFAHRTFADGVALTRQTSEGLPDLLATTGIVRKANAAVSDQLCRISAEVARDEARRMTAVPSLVWNECLIDGAPARLLSLPLPPDGGATIVISALYAPQSPVVDSAAEAMATRLQPVLAGYFRLWTKLRNERAGAIGLEAALHAQGIGLAVIDAQGGLIFVNTALQALVDAADGLRRQGRMLMPTDLSSAVKLQVAVTQAVAAASSGDEIRMAHLVPIRRARAVRLLAAVTPIANMLGEPGAAAAVIHVLDPATDGVRTLRPVCALYGLSPVETALVVRLVSGDTLASCADGLRIKPNTARAYLKRIFIKTETCRQADLVRHILVSMFRLESRVSPIAI